MPNPTDQEIINGKINNISRTLLPTGLLDTDYKGYPTWTNKQWAWEFLRRNRKFRIFCTKCSLKLYSDKEKKNKLNNTFGLSKFVSYKQNYNSKKVKFIAEHISTYSEVGNLSSTPTKLIKLMKKPGDLILKFNLKIASTSKKLLEFQLLSAKTILEAKSKQFAKNNKIKSNNFKNKAEYIDIIRLIDINNSNLQLQGKEELSKAEIYAIVFPKLCLDPKGCFSKSVPELQAAYSKKYEQAKKYMRKSRYLDLSVTKD